MNRTATIGGRSMSRQPLIGRVCVHTVFDGHSRAAYIEINDEETVVTDHGDPVCETLTDGGAEILKTRNQIVTSGTLLSNPENKASNLRFLTRLRFRSCSRRAAAQTVRVADLYSHSIMRVPLSLR